MNNLILEAEKYFQELSQEKEVAKSACFYIDSTLAKALNRQDIGLLLSLISYIEKGDGQISYKYFGEIHRILRILHIIEMEHKYQIPLFCSGCNDKISLTEKYMLTLFAFRRLLFHLSDASAEDAVSYLEQNPLSVFAVYVMIQDDLILPDSAMYQNIMNIYSNYWNESEKQLFLSLIRSS